MFFFLTKFKTFFKQKKLFKIKKTVCFVLNEKNMFFANPVCKRYINLTGISNVMKERSANAANYKCCKLPEMLPT
jgi:type IV secretory pathway TraG/TraD family ATPase VirD4